MVLLIGSDAGLWRRLHCLPLLALCSFLCTAALPSREHCPVQLLSIESSAEEHDGELLEELRLNARGLEYLRSLPSPLYIVPMLGVYRGGKSLVLNRLMGLQAPYEHGFGVGHGQDTYTRGIHMCAEYVEGLGSVVWMDTEGLFSAEDAHSAHGPKIFSLALLYSSIVLVNSVKVFNEQFFAFFGQQQQVARVLKQGLSAEGLPHSSLLPSNLSIIWTLSQPLKYDPTGQATEAQLRKFLTASRGDDLRHHVQRDFSHRHLEIPVATDAATQWGRLDELADDELSWDYITAVRELRSMVLGQLQHSRPLQAASIAKQLQIYVEAVQSKRFSIALAKEAFEEEQIGKICGEYGRRVAERVGDLPAVNIQDLGDAVMEELQAAEVAAIAEFHFTSSWSLQLKTCMQAKLAEMKRKNLAAAVERWQVEAVKIAAGASCFFFTDLMTSLENYTQTYGEGSESEAEIRKWARDHAEALQKTKLMECLRLKDLLVPFLPWLLWPVLSLYTRAGLVSGLLLACCHGIVLVGLYGVVGQMGGLLPPYLNVDYQILQGKPLLVDMMMKVLPRFPWVAAVRLCSGAGALWSAYRFLCHTRTPTLQTGGALVPLELKVNEIKENVTEIKEENKALRRLIEDQKKLLEKQGERLEQVKKHMESCSKQQEQERLRWEEIRKHMQSCSAMALNAPRSSAGQPQVAAARRLGEQAGSTGGTEPVLKPTALEQLLQERAHLRASPKEPKPVTGCDTANTIRHRGGGP